MQGDAKVTLAAHARPRPIARARRERKPLDRRNARLCARVARQIRVRCSNPMPCRSVPSGICSELTRHMPDDAIVVVDTGHAGMWMGGMYDLRAPTPELYAQRRPSRLGISCGSRRQMRRVPDRPVVAFTGDAGFWYHIAEIETAVRWGINSVTVVNNNDGGNQSKRGFDRAYGGEQTERRARIVDLQQDELCPARRGHGRARHPRREAPPIAPRPRSRARRQPARHHRRGYGHWRVGAYCRDIVAAHLGRAGSLARRGKRGEQ